MQGALPRTTPEAAGVDPTGVLAFLDAVEQQVDGLHSFMLLRRGQVAAEGWWAPYAPQHPHMLFSLSKSFTSTAVGLAVAEGLLTAEDPVVSFFEEDLPDRVEENLAAMRVRDLLTMTTGHATEPLAVTSGIRKQENNWARVFMAAPVKHRPGTHFLYNSAATYVLSAIVQKLAGVPLLEYLTPRLFEPLGIEGPTWESCPRGINVGGWGLSVTTEDIARFGQLYLQRGQWNGRRLIPETWVEAATSKQVPNGSDPESDWAQGYGYQFWRCRHGAYRGDGAFGQFCVVFPKQEAVLAITSGAADMQRTLNLVWKHLLPALKEGPAREGAGGELHRRLAALEVPAPPGKPVSPTSERVSGRRYRFEANDEGIESTIITFSGRRCEAQIRDGRGERRIGCDGGEWVSGSARLGERGEVRVAARGAWETDDRYMMKLCFYETPFIETMKWEFEADGVTVSRRVNVGFGPTERATLRGRMA